MFTDSYFLSLIVAGLPELSLMVFKVIRCVFVKEAPLFNTVMVEHGYKAAQS